MDSGNKSISIWYIEMLTRYRSSYAGTLNTINLEADDIPKILRTNGELAMYIPWRLLTGERIVFI